MAGSQHRDASAPFPPELRQAVWRAAREGDRDRYWAALFVGEPARTGLMTLAAFNAELSRIAETVSEPMLGEIRLQWWRDALGAGGGTGHAVADALGQAIAAHGLAKPLLQGLIDARIFDVSGDVMPDAQALGAYLDKTAGAMFALAAHVVSGVPLRPDRAAHDAGFAYGLTGLMRAMAFHRAQGRLYLPATAFTDQGLDAARVSAGEASAGLGEALALLRQDARAALARAREALAALEPEARVGFLPLALVEPGLAALERPRHEPLERVAEIAPLARLWRLTRAGLTGRI